MYNENEKRNIAVSQKGNAIQPAALNIHQLFPSRTKDECLVELKKNPPLYRTYLNWPDKWKSNFLEFMEGKKSLPLTYDPFFKKLFNPDIYPERLSRLISSIIGTNVTVKCILSNEDSMLPSTSLLLLDIIVQLEDGSIANVEIQKIPYTFPGERMSCYSADLLLRQYTRVKVEKGSTFIYQDLKTVYTIVMFENSPKECKDPELSDIYLHHGKAAFDTGIDFHLLQEYYVVALDVFQKSKYSKDINELNAWLSLLTATTLDDLAALISDYPWMKTIYMDMSEYLYHPEEVVTMFSEALRKLDENTVNYMIDELKKERDEAIAALSEKDVALSEKDAALAERDATVCEMSAEIAMLKAQLAERNK